MGKFEVRQQWDIASQNWVWHISQRMTTTNVGMDVGKKELSFIADGNTDWFKFLENYMDSSQKTKKWASAIPLLGIDPQKLS